MHFNDLYGSKNMKVKNMKITKIYLKDLVYKVNGAAIEVHKILGPGLLESVYHKALKHELFLLGINYKSELVIPVNYKGISLETKFRCDFFIENVLVVELKAVESIMPIHEAQLLTYMKLLDAPEGLMLNFNVTNIYYDGQKTYVTEMFRELPE